MDPRPSSASFDPPTEHEEGDSWVVVPDSEVLEADAPKVIDWEELQQELARLWSLSAAVAAARDRKAHLAARLESALEARMAFLQQDNELAEMRQRLHAHADFMGELKMRTKEVLANVEDRRAQLCVKIRMLSVASKTLGAAHSKLQQGHPRFSAENLETNKHLYLKMEELAKKHQCSPAQLALAWVLHQGDDVVPIPGTTKIKNLDANIDSLKVKLTDDKLKEITSQIREDVVGGRQYTSFAHTTWTYADTPRK